MITVGNKEFLIIFYIIPLIINIVIICLYYIKGVKPEDSVVVDRDFVWLWSFMPFFNSFLCILLSIIAPVELSDEIYGKRK